MTARLLRLFLLATACSAGCASPLVARVAPALSTAPQPFFVKIAEGLTAPSLTEPMRVVPQMFSSYQLNAACQTPRRIARLEIASRSVELRLGEALALSTLHVVAVSDANVAVHDVPIVIEAEQRSPPVVQLRTGDPDLAAGRLLSIGLGTFKMRLRTVCTNAIAAVTITGQVVP